MSIVKTALVAASLVFAITAANAQGREDLNSGFHGNTTFTTNTTASQNARGAFAQAGTVYRLSRMNPLNDMFHGLAVR
ncbi:hypothetical protein [Pseudorhodoplanes sinuspersici]|uniref:Uncharacterized protein n=1 Tax=Pseudorhodoplanes sinuspersici TaxID=1235591 RepID=A0A1W6ZK49_9HYPH|nr:hypothetical protein [Pseudorhodoplanes sinuspersici]ARP97756.1 hypothetical protein CAK95_00680 [Pseudorhodoplanes sinuspersici]RKE68519.1 hypothetical protein DFP91_4909 [Pseudorhodoplanes sinuspersici]